MKPLVVPVVLLSALSLVSGCSPAPKPVEPWPVPSAPAPATSIAPVASVVDAAAPAPSDDPKIDALSKEFVDLIVETSPETGTILGIHKLDAQLDDRSLARDEAIRTKKRALLDRVREAAKLSNLTRSARTDAAILESELEVDIRTREETHPLQRNPAAYATGPMNAIFLMLARDYAPAADRARLVLARMEKVPETIAAAKTNLTPVASTDPSKAVPPPAKVWTEVGIEMATAAASFFEEQRAPLTAALPSDKARIDQAIATAKKAYVDYKQFLQKTLLPRSTGTFAAGKPYFEFLLKRSYFLDMGADEVLAIGERILAETDARMTEVAHRIDPKAKSWPEVTARLKKKHPTAADLIPSYKREIKRARDFLVQKDAVGFPPGDDCEVIETPVFMRTTITAAYDQPPPFDAVTKGFFFVTPVDMTASKAKQEEMLRENDFGDQVNTSVHEAYPGHHLQLSFARRHPSLVRKATGPAIFAEGWGLYSEELMAELGYYNDEERLMQLEWTLVRAARVVIDVGLHTRGMTFDEALRILTDKVHLERALALSEVKRYTMEPTQPLSYLVGREAIFRLRDKFKEREGAKYSLHAFHTEVLSHGTIPPGLIGREMFGD